MHIATLLIDDDRDFTDGRDVVVARYLAVAEEIFFTDDGSVRPDVRVDEVWLDFVLGGGESGNDFARMAVRAAQAGTPLNIGVIHTHSESWGGCALMEETLEGGGYSVHRADLDLERPPLSRIKK